MNTLLVLLVLWALYYAAKTEGRGTDPPALGPAGRAVDEMERT